VFADGVEYREAGAPAAEEKSEYQVVLASAGANKIGVIKALREVNQERD